MKEMNYQSNKWTVIFQIQKQRAEYYTSNLASRGIAQYGAIPEHTEEVLGKVKGKGSIYVLI